MQRPERDSELTKKQLRDLQAVWMQGRPLGTDDVVHEVALGRLDHWERFIDPEPFAAQPTPCPVKKSHIDSDTGKVADRMRWSYHYEQTAFGSGTHYIFLESLNDTFDISPFGPAGFVVANGQGARSLARTLQHDLYCALRGRARARAGGAYERLKARILNGRALVMLHNTGGVTQAFGSLHRALLSSYFDVSVSALLQRIELVSPENCAPTAHAPNNVTHCSLPALLPKVSRLVRGARRGKELWNRRDRDAQGAEQARAAAAAQDHHAGGRAEGLRRAGAHRPPGPEHALLAKTSASLSVRGRSSRCSPAASPRAAACPSPGWARQRP
jgi:hypothetical protein